MVWLAGHCDQIVSAIITILVYLMCYNVDCLSRCEGVKKEENILRPEAPADTM